MSIRLATGHIDDDDVDVDDDSDSEWVNTKSERKLVLTKKAVLYSSLIRKIGKKS